MAASHMIHSDASDPGGPAIPDGGSAAGATGTDWSMIDRAVHGAGAIADQARETLMRRYWPAIYAYIRRSGRDVHDAADATQGFVCDVMIGRALLERADRRRGRFRSLLLTALKNYLHERHRRDSRKKRQPDGGGPVLFSANALAEMEVNTARTPEAAFAAQWAASLVRRVLNDVVQECHRDGLEVHWAIFEARVARPLMTGEPPVAYDALLGELDLDDSSQASNMMTTVKRRFARRLRAEIASTLPDDCLVEDEVYAMLRDLEGVK